MRRRRGGGGVAGSTRREAWTLGLGAWAPAKFYRVQRTNPADATVGVNVGELSPYRGMTYAEIASVSRSLISPLSRDSCGSAARGSEIVSSSETWSPEASETVQSSSSA